MHPLLQTTRRTSVQPNGVRPMNATYDFFRGLWIGPQGPLCCDSSHMPQSKKNDIETGEDQKGQ